MANTLEERLKGNNEGERALKSPIVQQSLLRYDQWVEDEYVPSVDERDQVRVAASDLALAFVTLQNVNEGWKGLVEKKASLERDLSDLSEKYREESKARKEYEAQISSLVEKNRERDEDLQATLVEIKKYSDGLDGSDIRTVVRSLVDNYEQRIKDEEAELASRSEELASLRKKYAELESGLAAEKARRGEIQAIFGGINNTLSDLRSYVSEDQSESQ